GSAISTLVHAADPTTRVESLGVPTRFVPHGEPKQIFARLGLDADGIARAARTLLDDAR
ncbi:MAG: hypothetical protein RLZZ01_2469, partial [Actinomycetota bacterium]